MNMEEIAAKLKAGLEKNPLTDSIKFDCGDAGKISIVDGKVELADLTTDCTIGISTDNLDRLLCGKLNPMTAFAMGKIKVSGDMSVAMKLGQMLK